MPRLGVFTLASALLAAGAAAQSQSDADNVRVYAAVAFINHGEKTPSLGNLQQLLTPTGAQQMFRQGNAFRGRYMDNGSDESASSGSGNASAPIKGLDTGAANNLQVNLIAAEGEWNVGSALSFYQGLYPPTTQSYSKAAGGDDLSRNLNESDSESIEYPLDGYQYPNLQTVSSLSSDSPSVQGHVDCSAWTMETNRELRDRPELDALAKENDDFYMDLFSSKALDGTVTSSYPKVWNAYELYELVSYMYTHNETVHDGIDANSTLARLQDNALEMERAKNTRPSSIMDEEQRDLYTIAGRTLAMKVADTFRDALSWDFSRSKLSVMVGSHEPLLAFLSVGKLLTRDNLESGPFSRFPQPGAALVFELVGKKSDNDTPSENDLSIRFYYRASADEDATFENYALFGSGFGGATIPYTAFDSKMINEGLSLSQWCDVCGEGSARWCPQESSLSEGGSSDGSNHGGGGSGGSESTSRLHPALAGLIGALIMGALTAGVGLVLFAVAGFRIRRVSPEERSSVGGSSSGGGGGFKGPEKRTADADMAVSPTGLQQERVGSWELRDGNNTGDLAGIVRNKGFGGREDARSIDDDDISMMGASPVNPRESV